MYMLDSFRGLRLTKRQNQTMSPYGIAQHDLGRQSVSLTLAQLRSDPPQDRPALTTDAFASCQLRWSAGLAYHRISGCDKSPQPLRTPAQTGTAGVFAHDRFDHFAATFLLNIGKDCP